MSLTDWMAKYKPLIDEALAGELARRGVEAREIAGELEPVLVAMEELSHGGKRMRGLLTLVGYELAGREVDGAIVQAAVVMELFHLGLLIQDDVMDRDAVRRGVATMHARYSDLHLGEAIAICAGDLTFGWGMDILARGEWGEGARRAALQVWARYFARVGYGQMLDMQKTATEETMLAVLALKSGEYSCVLPLQFGAALSGAPAALQTALGKYGMELGLVFQLRDDWLAEYGQSRAMGKAVGNDRREGKATLATMYGRERLEEEIARRLEEGRRSLQGLTLKDGRLEELLEWAARRES